ncbi:MAG: transposase [Parcubacteria group bacterium]|nr:transposase [Parcubacteria group bacterium]
MRKHSFITGEFYHVYAHGIADFHIFKQVSDYKRFTSLIFCANGTKPIPRLERTNDNLSLAWDITNGKIDIGDALVDIVCFALMSTHIHLLLREKDGKGVSVYMHKLFTSHAKYFNLKYDRRGRLFESIFQSRHVNSNRYLLHVSKYIHRNPEKISKYKNSYINYPWSSCQDFVDHNRWGRLLDLEPVVSQFKDEEDYQNYVLEPMRDDFPDLSTFGLS